MIYLKEANMMDVEKDNPVSMKVQKDNGAYIAGEN